MSETNRRPPDTDFQVRDRSDRVLLYGYARIMPGCLWLGGIIMLVVIASFVRIPSFLAVSTLCVTCVVPLVLDRSKLLDPVVFINFGEYVMVKRMMTKKSLPLERIRQIEFSSPTGEDYDDRLATQSMCDITIRFRRSWTARIQATNADAAAILRWAKSYELKVLESPSRRAIQK